MKSLFSEMGGTYSQQGDYLLPDVKLPPQEDRPIGIWGQRRREFLKSRHKVKYYNMLTKCTLYAHLADISEAAEAMEDRLTRQLKEQEGSTEALKSADPMAWVSTMNSIAARVKEIIYAELINC